MRTPVLIVLTIAALVGLAACGTSQHRPALSTGPRVPNMVKLDPAVRPLIAEFVRDNLSRKHLAAGYRLLGPGMKQGISAKSWAAGHVTVVPYPVDAKTHLVFETPQYSYATRARFPVRVVTPDRPNEVKLAGADRFFVDVIKRQGRWLVNLWVPRWTPPIATRA
ncbi:MAG TPA: hypothetical protein VGH79_08905 [Gaiellaceae bacterium]|jgi:hypothetical protein